MDNKNESNLNIGALSDDPINSEVTNAPCEIPEKENKFFELGSTAFVCKTEPNEDKCTKIEQDDLGKDEKDTEKNLSLSKSELKSISRHKKWEKRMRFQPKSILGDSLKRSNYHEEFLKKEKGEKTEYHSVIMPQKQIIDHLDEIKSMLNALKQHSGSKTAMQLLPNYMRRRAASHNTKRLPRNLRDLAQSQMQGSDDKKKTVYRKKRRRKVDLQNEYAKQKGKQGWLETHLWHSKRFRMSEEKESHYSDWGCRVALKPYQKCFRPSYRAVAKHCTVQDISFYKCLELGGSNQNLFDLLSSFVLDQMPPLKNFLTGCLKERELLLYDRSTDPARCVGPVLVMFTPMDENKGRRVWMWLHPAIFTKVIEMLNGSKKEHSITVEDISTTLNRFRLIGPKSSVTLLSVLRLFSYFKQASNEDQVDGVRSWLSEHKSLIQKQHSLFVSVMKDQHNRHFHTEATVSSAPLSNPGDVFSLFVNDPRLTLPVHRTNPSLEATAEPTKHDDVDDFKLNLLRKSPLFVSSYRAEVSASRRPDHVVSTRKHETKLCVGKELKNIAREMATPVPVALVRRAGYQSLDQINQKISEPVVASETETPNTEDTKQCRTVHGGPMEGFGSGWDIIIPSNWGMAFWIPFIYHQARPIGMEMHHHSNLEYKTPTFPQDYPDTEAGLRWWTSELRVNHKKYYRKPPAKRPNFALLATQCPFAPCWKLLFQKSESKSNEVVSADDQPQIDLPRIHGDVLVSDDLISNKATSKDSDDNRKRTHSDVDNDDEEEEPAAKILKIDRDYESFLPFVLRDKNKLEQLDKLIKSNETENDDVLSSLLSDHKITLVCVKVAPINRGVPAPQTSICIPEAQDLDKLHEDFSSLYNNGLRDCLGPKEGKHWDPYRKERKEATKAAKKNRKRKPDKRVKIDRKTPSIFDVPPSREVAGYVTSGNFLFSFATGGGVGFINIDALPKLLHFKRKYDWLSSFMNDTLHSNGLLSLMRNIDCDQYRFITLELVK